MRTLPQLSTAELEVISKAHQQMLTDKYEGQAFALNPSNPLHKKLVLCALNAAGQTRDRYPNLYSAIDGYHGSDPGAPNKMAIIDAGKTESGKATAMIWYATEKECLYSGASTMILDGETSALIGFGACTDVQAGFMQCGINAQTAKPVAHSIKIIGVSYTVGHDGAANFTAIAGSRTFGASETATALSISVTAPVISTANPTHKSIHIAVGRDAQHSNPDADYFYTETTNKNDPNLIVPFVGTATLPYTIPTGTTSANIQDTAIIWVDYGTSSVQLMLLDPTYTPQATLNNAISISGNTVSWSFPYDSLGVATTKSLVFVNGPVNDKLSYFSFQFVVPVTGGPSPANNYVFTVYSYVNEGSNQPFNGSENGLQIPPMTFWWHCLAAGTQVTMADGSQMNIEDLTNQHRVRTGNYGASLAVEKTTLGHHEANANQAGLQAIYRLRTEDGKELITTGAHPIMTANGAVMSCHLNKGDLVLVSGGVSAVSSCEPIQYSGMFYGLKLGNSEDRAKAAQSPVCAFQANGIHVGDHVAMIDQADSQRTDLDFTLPRISPTLRTDYINAVSDRNG